MRFAAGVFRLFVAHCGFPARKRGALFQRDHSISAKRVDREFLLSAPKVLEPELALKLGVAPNRIDTIIDFAAAAKYGVKAEGNHEAATADVLGQLAGLLAAGRLEIPIAKVYPRAEVRDAYRELEQRHTRGKIVLEP